MEHRTTSAGDELGEALNRAHLALSRVAREANFLAKQLSGREEALAYQIKAKALSSIVVNGVAAVSGYVASIRETCVRRVDSPATLKQHLLSLRELAHSANRLAKALVRTEWAAFAYEIKHICLSALIRGGKATVSEINLDGSIGLDILLSPQSSLHTFLDKLDPDAELIIRSQLGIGRAPSLLADRLAPSQIEFLRTFPTHRKCAA